MNSATASLFCCEQFGERSEGQLQRHHETAQLAVEMGSDVNLLAFLDRYCQVEQNLPVLRKDSAGSETENQ